VNLYGATEVSVDSTWWATDDQAFDGLVLVGRPMANQAGYVLDSRLNPVPIGAFGEIVLGGKCVARGYARQPTLTAERFVPDPFAADPSARMYRTGDIGRWTADGQLELRGRLDHQIKLHGTRIEPGEVESLLTDCSGVTGALVLVEGQGPAARLVAYVTGSGLDENALQGAAAARLPDTLVPARIGVLEKFPRLPSGKIDRSALPTFNKSVTIAQAAPMTVTEAAMARIWSSVIGSPVLSASANFFQAGGNSLDAVRLVGRLADEFQKEVGLAWVFTHQSVAEMARAIGNERRIAEPPTRVDPRLLSSGEQRMWFLDQASEQPGLYVMTVALRLSGGFDQERLIQAVEEVLRRHEGLISRVVFQDGHPRRELGSDLPRVLFVNAVNQPSVLTDTVIKEAKLAHIEIKAGPLVKAALIARGQRGATLVLAIHHMAADGWAVDLLLRQIRDRYIRPDSLVTGDRSLPGVGTLLAQEEAGLAEGLWARDLVYWRKSVGELTESPAVPTDRPRLMPRSGQGSIVRDDLDLTLLNALRRRATEMGTTPYTLVFTAVALLVQRMTESTKVTLGTMVANRNPAVRHTIGMCANTLAVPLSCPDDGRLRDATGHVHARLAEAYDHAAVPFSRVVEELGVERDSNRNPLFDVLVLYRDDDYADSLAVDGVEVAEESLDSGVAKLDLTFQFTARTDALNLVAEFSTDLYEPVTVRRWVDRLAVVLEQMVSDPDLLVGDLTVMPASERELVTRAWNDTHTDFPGEDTVWDLFRLQAESTPDALAVISETEGENWTYRQLLDRACSVATSLATHGAVGGSRVGVHLRRGADMVAVLLGTLAAGAAYVPLDPEYPADRLTYMADNAEVALIVTDGQAPTSDTPVVTVRELLKRNGPTAQHARPRPSDLAYIIYTSGSTGRPKGVMVEHQAAVNRLVWMIRHYGFGPGDRVLLKTPYSFDVSVWEFFGPLISGATLVVLPPDHHWDPVLVLECVNRDAVTIIHFVPSMLGVLLDCRNVRKMTKSLRLVVCSGEVLPPSIVSAALDRLDARLENLYGPTEAAVDVTAFAASRESIGATVPIGRPIANVKVYVVDGDGRPQPIGVEGDVAIGGVGLARGYAAAPALTASRFRPDHLGDKPSGRLYMTGDRGIWNADGMLEFRGRGDHQVKVRGLRIELEEIEHALVDLGLATQVAVVAHGEGESAYLVAYIVTEHELDAELCASRLSSRLPSYMVPGVFLRIEALPLSANGKLRRDQLPKPAFDLPSTVASLTKLEEAVALVWEGILGIRPPGRDSNFFCMGGNSMALMRLSVALHDRFGVSTPLSMLLHRPTLERIASVVQRLRNAAPGEHAGVAIRPVRAPASSVQRRIWIDEMISGCASKYNVQRVLELSGPVDSDRLRRAIAHLQQEHPLLRATLRDQPEGLQITVSDAPGFVLLTEDLSGPENGERSAKYERIRLEHARQRLPLDTGPVGAATLVKLAADRYDLLLCFHHCVVDVRSLDVICRDLAATYSRNADGVTSAPSYLHYCERDDLSDARQDSLNWWADELNDVREFTLARTVTAVDGPVFAGQPFTLGQQLTQGLEYVAQARGISLFEMALTAWGLALQSESGLHPIIAVQVSTRPPEYADTVGPFINQIPVVAPSVSPADPAGYCDALVERWRGYMEHADTPFDEILAACRRTVGTDGSALTGAGFSFTAETDTPVDRWGEVIVRTVAAPSPSQAKSPVFLELRRGGDGLGGVIEYRSDLHDRAQITRLQTSLERALRSLLTIATPRKGQ
jgi:nonribosomal peptide synthetase protein VioA